MFPRTWISAGDIEYDFKNGMTASVCMIIWEWAYRHDARIEINVPCENEKRWQENGKWKRMKRKGKIFVIHKKDIIGVAWL